MPTVSCVDEVRKKVDSFEEKYDVSNLKLNHWVSIVPEIKSFSIVCRMRTSCVEDRRKKQMQRFRVDEVRKKSLFL